MVKIDIKMNQMKKLWVKYINCSPTDPKEKTKQLNEFLDYCIIENKNNSLIDCQSNQLSVIVSIGNILINKFMSDVHNICSHLKQTDDSSNAVINYLNEDMGSKLIQVIHVLNSKEGLLYNCELSYLLVHLLPILVNEKRLNGLISDVNENECRTLRSINDCFLTLTSIQLKPSFNECLSPSKVKSWVKTKKSMDRFQSSGNQIVSDSDDSEIKLYNIHVNKTPLIPLSDFNNYENNSSFDSNDNRIEDKENIRHDSSDDNDRQESQLLSNPNPIELFSIIVEILTEYAVYEQLFLKEDNETELYSLVPRVSYYVAEELSVSIVYFFKLINETNSDLLIPVMSGLKDLLFISCCTLSRTNSGLKLFESIKLSEHLFEIMEYLSKIANIDANSEVNHIFSGLLLLMTSVCQYLNYTKEYAIVLKLIRLDTSQSAKQLLLFITSNASQLSDIESIVSALKQLITALQRAKLLYVHRTTCSRKRHSKCNLNPILSHHNNILGTQVSHSTSNRLPFCCISSVYNLLLSIALNTKYESIEVFVTQTLTSIITCCCNFTDVSNSLLKFYIKTDSTVIRKDIFKIIENNIRNQKSPDLECCQYCENGFNCLKSINGFKESSFSEGYITDNTNADNQTTNETQELFSTQYKLLLNSKDVSIRRLVSKHLLNLINYCNESTKCILFQFVIMPSFFAKDTPPDIMQVLLQLLGSSVNDSNVVKMFISFGGLSNLRQLLRNKDFSLLAINVLEVLVINEIENHLNINQSDYGLDENYSSLSTFLDIICEDTDKSVMQIRRLFDDNTINSLDSSLESINLLNDDINQTNDYEFSPIKLNEHLKYVSNLWFINLKLVNISTKYSQLIRNPTLYFIDSVYSFFLISLNLLIKKIIDFSDNEESVKVINILLNLIELLLPVCLQLCPFQVSTTELLIDKNEIMSLIKHQINELRDYGFNGERSPLIQTLNMLINCSLNISQVSSNIFSQIGKNKMNFFSDDLSFDLSKGSNEEEDEDLCCDSGYDADIESMESSTSVLNLMTRPNSRIKTTKHLPFIKYGEMCKIVIQYLSSNKESFKSETNLQNVSQIIQKLIKYCKENPENLEVLYENNFISLLLNGFNSLLKNGGKESRAVQSAILDLIVQISHFKINSDELKLFLNLFKDNRSQLDLCLNALYQILSIRSAKYNLCPLYCLTFPAEPILVPSLNENNQMLSSIVSQMRHSIVYDSNVQPNQISWSSAAIAIPLPKVDPMFNTSNKAFSIAFWVYFDKNTYFSTQISNETPNSNNLFNNLNVNNKCLHRNDFRVHLMSIAFDAITIEIWFDFHFTQFVYKICKLINGKSIVYSEENQEIVSDLLGKWHLLRFNFKEEFLKRSSSSLAITQSIDGIKEKTVKLNFSNVIPKNPQSMAILLGTVHNIRLRWQIGNCMLFRNIISLETTLYLFCLGSDFCNFFHSKSSDNQSPIILPKILSDSDFVDVMTTFYELSKSNKSLTLEENILIVYKPIKSDQFLVYHSKQIIPSNSYLPNLSKISLPMRFMTNSSQPNPHDFDISEHKVIEFGQIGRQFYYSVHKAVFDAGGIGIIMFLFAHIIDTTSDEKMQSKSLEILLKVFDSHVQHRDMFIDQYDGLSLVKLILENPKAVVSHSMLRTFIQFCISSYESDAVITSSKGIAIVISSWKAWHRNPNTIKGFYQTIVSLISSTNPYKSFNIFQMKKANALQSIIFMIQEMYIQLNYRKELHLTKDSLVLLLRIVKILIGRPPDISLLSEIFDCVLLLHKAESAFISQSRNSFYYLFPSIWNIDMEFGSRRTSLLDVDVIDVEEWEIISEDEISLSEELADDCPDQMIAGLIAVISDTIESLSDDYLIDKVVGPIIKLEYLIVLANNKSFKVREAVMTALYICVKRCKSKEVMNLFLKTKGFHLMANQLHRYPASQKLITVCFGLILGVNNLSEFTLEDTIESKKSFNNCDAELFVPLFALLPKTVYDISLSHNSLETFYRLMSSFNTSFLKELYENGLLECLAKVLINHNIYKQKIKSLLIDTIDGYEEDSINNDINHILKEFSSLFFFSSGANNHQIFCSAIQFFSVLEKKALSANKQMFRECQIALFESAFDCIQFISNETKSLGYKSGKLAIGANTAELFFNMFTQTEDNYDNSSIGANNNDNFDSSSFASFDNSDRIRNNLNKIQLNSKEIIERFKDLIIKSIDFILFKAEESFLNEKEKYFSRSILHIMLQTMESLHNESPRNKRKNVWINILFHSRDTIRSQISRLVLYLISPLQSTEDRQFCISLITSFNCFNTLIKSNEDFGYNFKAFLLDLIDTIVDSKEIRDLRLLIKKVIDCQTIADSEKHYKELISNWFETLSEMEKNFDKSIELAKEKAFNKMKPLSRRVIEIAMSVTRSVVEAQNKERKQYIYLLKKERTNSFMQKNMWKLIVNQFTNETAVWYFPDAYPNSWSLDPIEAPNRIRRKMKRCPLNIDDRFFIEPKNHKNVKQLLSYIFNSDSSDSSAVIDRLHANERITYTSKASVITPDEEFPGEILISNSCIHFISEVKQTNHSFGDNILTKVLPFDEIQEILKRRYQLQNNALEIFLTNGLTYLIGFVSNSEREEFYTQIIKKNLTNLSESNSLVALTQMWRERQISNFEYLTHLNKISGRTFNDLMQYPIFPVILADYENQILDLRDANSFRNLSKPIAIQKKGREKYYIEQYNYLKNEYERNARNGEYMMAATTAPFHYGAHYSNSGTVLHFLVRLPPFTQMFLNYQDNNFDIPDRTFHSMATSWKLATSESTTDFKELIPEFFFLPEFLMNNENFNFGVRQNGERVNNVQLPHWSRNNARLFVLINRQALESNHVTLNLNKWIDLVFGYKQTGKAAIEAINVFHPSTYYGTDVSKIEDPLKRMAIQTMIKTFGQMPRQLFHVTHPVLSQDVQLPNERDIPHVMGEVLGLKWGSYVGSPSESDPIVLLKKSYSVKISQLIALTTNDVFAMPPKSSLFLTYSRQKGGALINASYITSVALFLWSNPDTTIKIKLESSTMAFTNANVLLDEITICMSVPNYDVLLVGYASGLVNAYVIAQPLKSNQKIEMKRPETTLYGHSSSIKSIAISKSFTIAVTGDLTGVCILWDLNCFCYVRTLSKHNFPIELLAISETLGDIVSISHNSNKQMESTLFVHTINGDFIGQVMTDSQITAVSYSTAPEGLSVNVIATAFIDGTIKLWSSWDLSPVRQFKADIDLPINCLNYSNDNQLLYVVYSDNTVVVWENSNKRTARSVSLTLL